MLTLTTTESYTARAVIVGYDDELMEALTWAPPTGFRIDSILDFTRPKFIGGQLAKHNFKHLRLLDDPAAIGDTDLVIIGPMLALRIEVAKHQAAKALEWTLNNSRAKIFPLGDAMSVAIEPKLVEAGLTDRLYRRSNKETSGARIGRLHRTPTLAVAAVSDKLDAEVFRAHLAVRAGLQQLGYTAAGVSTNPYANMVGLGYLEPIPHDSVNPAFDPSAFSSMELALREAVGVAPCDIAIASCAYPLFYRRNTSHINDKRNIYKPCHGHTSLGWLMAVDPDLLVLVASPSDETEAIVQALRTSRAVTGANVVAIAHTGKIRRFSDTTLGSNVLGENIDLESSTSYSEALRKALNIMTFDLRTPDISSLLARQVIACCG